MGGHHQAYLGSNWRQGDGLAIVERAGHPTFRMGAHLIRGTGQRLLDHLQIQEMVVTTSGNYSKASSEDIDERSGIAIETIQTKQHGSGGKPKFCRIAGAHPYRPQQFASVIPIARPTKGAQKLMRMRLEDDRAGTHDFSPLAFCIARLADLIKTTMRGGQRLHLRERTLTSGGPGSIHIHNPPWLSCSIHHSAWRGKRLARNQVLEGIS